MANLVEVLRGGSIKTVIRTQDGSMTEQEIHIGNNKGFLVFTIGNEHRSFTQSESEQLQEQINPEFIKRMLDNGAVVLPFGVQVEYIKVE